MTDRVVADGLRGRSGASFFADEALIEAANVALALEVPLLLTGDPGCGKTDFAFAVARQWAGNAKDWDPDGEADGLLQAYIRSDTTAKDLLYHYDSLRRFGQAQHGDQTEKAEAQDARRFVDLMALGLALNSRTRRVLLLDEVDKAPRDLPNDLLRELDQGRFTIPEIPLDAHERYGHAAHLPKREMGFGKREDGAPKKPFIIVTSNQERQLPNAFLRRCAFCHLELPDDAQLKKILNSRFSKKISNSEADRLIHTFGELRRRPGLTKPPGTSELIAWVQALVEVLPNEKRKAAIAFDPKKDAWKNLPGRMTLLKLPEDERKLT